MPTYVYRRSDGTTFEHFQKISDDALTADPETGVPVQRVISGGAGLQFKGSGFYLTDYVKKSGSADAEEPGGPKKKEPAKPSESKSSDTKATKAETKAPSKPTSATSSD